MLNWDILKQEEDNIGGELEVLEEPIDKGYFLNGLSLLSKGTLGDPDRRLIYNVVVSGDTIRVRIFDNDRYFGDEYKATITMDGDNGEYEIETTGIFNHQEFEPYGKIYPDFIWRINQICDGPYLPEFNHTPIGEGLDLYWFVADELEVIKKNIYYLKYDFIDNYHLKALAPILALTQWEHNKERKYFHIKLDPDW